MLHFQIIIVILIGVVICIGAYNIISWKNDYRPNPPLQTKTSNIHGTILNVEVATTESELTRGLSGRIFLSPQSGMLFVFPSVSRWGIWMKDMYFPLDIVWLDQNFHVVDIAQNISPNTYPTTFTPSQPALYVLELNAGMTKSLGLTIGDSITFTEK